MSIHNALAQREFRPCAVIPNYNHKDTIEAVVARLRGQGLPCIVVNDGSDEATRQVLERLVAPVENEAESVAEKASHIETPKQPVGAKDVSPQTDNPYLGHNERPKVYLFHHETNQGKGGAVKTGLRQAHQLGFSHALQVDADGQHDLNDIPRMLQAAQAHPESLVLGRPIFDESIPKGRLYPRYITHVWVWIETLSLEIKDSMCGYRVYPLGPTLRLLDRVRLGDRMDFDIEIAVRLFWANVPFVSVDTAVLYHPGGISHFRLWLDNVLISWLHTRLFLGMLWRAPLLLFRKRAQPGSGDVHWSKTQERGSAWGIRFVLGAYKLFGRTITRGVLYPIIGYFFLTGRRARQASLDYLQRLYATEEGRKALDAPPGWGMSFRHFLSFGEAALDKLSAWSGDIKRSQVNWPNREELLALIEKKQGAVLLGAHLGNIEVLRAIAEDNPALKMNVLMFTAHAAQFNAVLRALNPNSQIELIAVEKIDVHTGILLQERVARGEMVAILADRVPEGTQARSQAVSFLGAPAPFPEGPFILASLLACPVFLLLCLRDGKGQYDIHLEHFSDRIVLPRQQRRQALSQTLQEFAQRLEKYCYLAPYQWYNFFNFWNVPTGQEIDETQDN